MANVKTITATTTESTVEFSATYQFMWFRNYGENDCYICAHSGIVANADDVTLLKAGEVARLTLPQAPAQSKAYIKAASGSNAVEVHAQNYSDCPFKRQGKGGEQITVESLTATENTTYTAPTGTAYSPVTVNVPVPKPIIQPLSVTVNDTYTAPSGIDGYSPVTVAVPTGAEIITRSDWNALTTAQKQAKGLVAIQDSTTGFQRGIFVNGADYLPDAEMLYYGSQNAASAVSLSYTVVASGTYQIILNTTHGDVAEKNNLTITVNGTPIQSSYAYPTENNYVAINIYKAEVELDAGDVVSFTFTSGTRYNNAGIQMFVMSNSNINVIDLYNSASNNGATFNIDLNSWYLQVAKTGYYSGGNTFEYHEIDNEPATSIATTSASSYWYGGTYVLRLQ